MVKIIELSRASYRKMVQNLVWATGYNVVALPLAAGVLAPVGILLSPAVGALLMSLSTIIVALNAQLLRRETAGVSGPPAGTPPIRRFSFLTGGCLGSQIVGFVLDCRQEEAG